MITLLNAVSPLDWFKLAAALVLFAGPGLALLSFSPLRRTFDVTQTALVALCLSLSIWAVLLAWLQLAGIFVNAAVLALGLAAAWVLALARLRPDPRALRFRAWTANPHRFVLWAIVLATALLSLWLIQGMAVGSNLDSYHHTLILQMIVERGGLPDSYEPLVPVATFSYHFGFHAFAAALGMLTGIRPVSLMPITGQLLMAGMALGVAFLAEALFADRRIALVAAALTGLVSPVPAEFGDWGRYPQLTGLMLLCVFIAIVYRWARRRCDWAPFPLLAVLAAGLVLTHYRVTLMAACGIPLIVPFALSRAIPAGQRARGWLLALVRAALPAGAALLLTVPWLVHVYRSRSVGYAFRVGTDSAEVARFFDLNRLGPWVLDHPAAGPLIALAALSLLVAVWQRQWLVAVLAGWIAALSLVSVPRLLGQSLDIVTVTMSLFVQGTIMVGWFVARLAGGARRIGRGLEWALWLALALASIGGILHNTTAMQPNAVFVQKEDLDAMAWIRANTPPSAVFAVNLFHFEFDSMAVAGTDAGGWIPLLAQRRAFSLPLNFAIERSPTPDGQANVVQLDRLNGQVASPAGIELLRLLGVTHLYIGVRGGPIDVAALLKSPAFKLDFQSGAAYVFRFIPGPF